MIKISSPPKIELPINLKIAFTGIENTLPIIPKAIKHPTITKTLEKSKTYHHTFISS